MRNMLAILLLSLASTVGLSQSKNGTATANGQCSIAISGNNNTIPSAKDISGSCGIGKEQGEKIIQLLNIVLSKKDIGQISAKLDELIQIAKRPVPQVLNCVGSNCVQNGTQNNYDQRSYGVPKPLPDIVNMRTEQLAPENRPTANQGEPNANGQMMPYHDQATQNRFAYNPGVTVTFATSKAFANPMFAIFCDRPCVPISFAFGDGQGHSGWSGSEGQFLSTNSPNIWVSQYGMKNLLLVQEFARATFRSMDDQPIEVIKVESYAP